MMVKMVNGIGMYSNAEYRAAVDQNEPNQGNPRMPRLLHSYEVPRIQEQQTIGRDRGRSWQ